MDFFFKKNSQLTVCFVGQFQSQNQPVFCYKNKKWKTASQLLGFPLNSNTKPLHHFLVICTWIIALYASVLLGYIRGFGSNTTETEWLVVYCPAKTLWQLTVRQIIWWCVQVFGLLATRRSLYPQGDPATNN